MQANEIVGLLSDFPDVQAMSSGSHVRGYLPALADSFQLVADDVEAARPTFAPYGDAALQFGVRRGQETAHLIVTNEDVVFPPAESASLLDSPVPVDVSNAPHLVAYSEMQRDVENVARACEQGENRNLDGLAGSFLLLRCFIAGAVAFGMHPVTSVAWWQRGWQVVGEDLPLPPFRRDPVWDDLVHDASLLSLTPTPVVAEPPSGNVTRADFEILRDTMRVIGIDDEFVAAWNHSIIIHPSTFTETLTHGLPGATFDLSLYPGGHGNVDLRLHANGALNALLQLRFSLPEQTLYIDEIRITEAARGGGLFQRLLFNAEQLAEKLGLGQVNVLASGIGSYALAGVGRYPR
jgi:hypothetical protein